MQTDSVEHSCVHEDLLQDGNWGPLSFFSLGGVGEFFGVITGGIIGEIVVANGV